MIKKKFQIGSKPKCRKSSRIFWRYIRIFGKLSLADISTAPRIAFCWIRKLNWIKLLKGVNLVMEIVEKIRTLLFCEKTLIGMRDNNISR
jgi:hypothetical protein